MIRIDPTQNLTAQLREVGLSQHCPHKVTLLYRFRNTAGELLYVGITCNPPIRWQHHKNGAKWWPLVESVEIEEHRTGLAEYAEVRAIREESPLYNVRSSLNAHGALTEVVRDDSYREGKGRGREGRLPRPVIFIVEVCIARGQRASMLAEVVGAMRMTGYREGSAYGHRSMRAIRPTSRRRCGCGCGRRATHVGLGDGLAMTSGCELSIRRWVRDGPR